jgi:hypothetical protein
MFGSDRTGSGPEFSSQILRASNSGNWPDRLFFGAFGATLPFSAASQFGKARSPSLDAELASQEGLIARFSAAKSCFIGL